MKPWSKRVSILIVSWNGEALLRQCVDSLFQADSTCLQIVIVDNGSSPPLQPIPGTQWIRSDVNLGFAGGNNLGLPHCQGEYLLLLNNDTQFPDLSPIQTLVAFLDAHPTVAAAQAKLIRPDGTLDTCGEFLTSWGVLYHHGYCQPDGPHAQTPFPIYAAKGACCLIRQSALPAVGNILFRDDYFCYGEDLELCHRFWLTGWEVWFVPTNPILHLERATSAKLPTRIVWRHYLSNLLTTACDYWSTTFWLRLGGGFLCFLIAGALLKGIYPKRRKQRLALQQTIADAELLNKIWVRVPFHYLLQCFTRRFRGIYR